MLHALIFSCGSDKRTEDHCATPSLKPVILKKIGAGQRAVDAILEQNMCYKMCGE